MSKDDYYATTIIVSGVTTDDFDEGSKFGIRLTSVTDNSGGRDFSSKVTGNAMCCTYVPPPAPPAPVCGNGITEPGQECANGAGNSNAADAACRPDCTQQRCGDGVKDSNEDCDEGAGNSDEPGATCRPDCKPQRCGDGILDIGEECDAGAANSDTANALCRTDCKPPRCGDGIKDSGEDCDPPNGTDCDANCKTSAPACPEMCLQNDACNFAP